MQSKFLFQRYFKKQNTTLNVLNLQTFKILNDIDVDHHYCKTILQPQFSYFFHYNYSLKTLSAQVI